MSSTRRTYRFGPLERRGLLGPVRTGQGVTLAAGALSAVVVLDSAPSIGGLAGAITVLALAAALAAAPLGGRTAEEWAPVLAGYALRAARGRHAFRHDGPGGAGSPPRAPRRRRRAADRRPAGLEGIELVELGYGGRRIGVVSERGGRRLTAVLACRVVAFSLLDAGAQERRLANWGLVLSSLAGSPVRRVQWIERTSPAQGDEQARWLLSARDPEVPLRGTPIIESYLELIAQATRVTNEHEVLIALQVDGARIRSRGNASPVQALVEQAERVARGLEAAEVDVVGALTAGQLSHSIRTGFDPFARAELSTLAAVERRDGLPATAAWPLAAQEAWEDFRCDGSRHATFWISSWPRTEVSSMFMDALLGPSRAVRAVAVTFEPVSPERSTREVEAAVTRDRADRELRSRFGQSETARQRQAQESAMLREAELAAGHSEVRVAGFVTVSGRDEQELRASVNEVLEHAARARLQLRRLYGQQAEAFTFTLPLARGLR